MKGEDAYKRYCELKEKHGVTDYRVAIETGVLQVRLSQWKAKGCMPKYETMRKIANYFGVSTDYFYSFEADEKAERNEVIIEMARLKAKIKRLADKVDKMEKELGTI